MVAYVIWVTGGAGGALAGPLCAERLDVRAAGGGGALPGAADPAQGRPTQRLPRAPAGGPLRRVGRQGEADRCHFSNSVGGIMFQMYMYNQWPFFDQANFKGELIIGLCITLMHVLSMVYVYTFSPKMGTTFGLLILMKTLVS